MYVCPLCGAEVAMFCEDIRIGRLFLMVISGSVLGGIVAFTRTMLYVGVVDTYRLVAGACGFSVLVLLALGWLVRRLREGGQQPSDDHNVRSAPDDS